MVLTYPILARVQCQKTEDPTKGIRHRVDSARFLAPTNQLN